GRGLAGGPHQGRAAHLWQGGPVGSHARLETQLVRARNAAPRPMIDITHKPTTLREAIATALVTVSDPATIDAVRERRVPKGDVLESARVAALFGVKKTHELIPDCHP